MRNPASLRRGRGYGFTLVEVLVAMVIMAIMAGMAWQGVDGIVRARDASQERMERTLRVSTVIAQWEQDLSAVQDTLVVPPLSFDGATLRVTRRTPNGMQLVAWSLRPSPTGSAWLRWASPVVTRVGDLQEQWLRSQQLQGAETGQLRTVNGLLEWQVYFFYGNGWSNAQSTGNVEAVAPGASAPLRQALPSGVRIVLSFAPGSGYDGTLTRDVLLAP